MNTVIDVDRLTVDYGKNRALDSVCLVVNEGEYLGIIGPNGGGKSTLLGAIIGTVRPTSGNISLFGGNAAEGRRRLGYVPQFAALDRAFPITVGEVVATAYLGGGLHPFRFLGKREAILSEGVLEEVGLGGFSRRLVSELSGGEFQRMLLARALAKSPDVLLLDEPTSGVDPATRARIYELLEEKNRAGLTILMVTHDTWWNESVMNQATDRAYRMGQDKSVQVYKLILQNTLEEKIMELQEKKSALSSLVVGKENDLNEIINLLKQQV